MHILEVFGKHRRALALVLLIASVSLLANSLVRWQGTLSIDPDLRPVRAVYFSAAVVLQAAEAAFRSRTPVRGVVVLTASLALLVFASLSPS
jgi:hypothetical protein